MATEMKTIGKPTLEAKPDIEMGIDAPAQLTMEGTHQAAEGKSPPSLAYKCCCPMCAVYKHEGCGKALLCSIMTGGAHTICCWKPKE